MKLNLVSQNGQVAQVTCEGRVTQLVPDHDEPLVALLGPGCFSRTVLLDLAKADYIDSSGISWLLIAHKHFLEGGGKLVLHSLSPRVTEVFNLLRLPSVLNLAPDEATARALVQELASGTR